MFALTGNCMGGCTASLASRSTPVLFEKNRACLFYFLLISLASLVSGEAGAAIPDEAQCHVE